MTNISTLTTGERLADAVFQSSKWSMTGMLEALFARAFHGLVYPQIWEDPVVDMEAMDIKAHHEILCIASGSCNALSYLAANPSKVIAVDLSPAHVALGRLKQAAVRELPDHEALWTFLVDAASKSNVSAYDNLIAPVLDDVSRAYWNRRNRLGRRRISIFKSGLYKAGLLGRTISALHVLAWFHGRDLTRFLDCKSLAEQRAFFESEIAPLFDKGIVRFIASHRASLFGLGIPPAQFDLLAGPEGDMVRVLKERTEKLACDFPVCENYFARQAFGAGYGMNRTDALPPFLEASNHETVRANINRYSIHQANLIELLRMRAPKSLHRYVLLDAQDWMNDRQLNELWMEITRTAADDARVIFRSAGKPSILDGRVSDAVLSKWKYQPEKSLAFTKADRSAIYGGFHLYEKR